jgi:hypothetical protein
MSNETTTTSKKTRVGKKTNGAHAPSPALEETAVATSSPVEPVAQEVSEPEVSIDMLMQVIPEEAKQQLAFLKDQIASAPAPIQKALAGYIFGSDPKVSLHSSAPTTPSPNAFPVDQEKAKELTQQIAEQNKDLPKTNPGSHLRRKFPDVEIPYGFKDMPTIHLYSSEVNDYAPLQFVALDLLQFGARTVIVAKSKRKVNALTSMGAIVEIPAKAPFGIVAEGDMVLIVKPTVEDPAGAFEYFVTPTCIENVEGFDVTRFRVMVGERFERAKLWP